MARLYYEKNANSNQLETLTDQGQNKGVSDYLEKVARLVPSEVVAGYLTMIGFVGSIKSLQVQNITTWIIFGLGLILTPIYLNNVADADKPKRNHIILSTVAFVVWAYVTSGQQLMQTIAPGIFDQAIASIVLVAFSLVSAVVPLNK
jgi:hypothetical protein